MHRSHEVLEQVAPGVQDLVDPPVDAVLDVEVPDGDVRELLPDAVDTPDPLLDPARVPRQVVVDEGTGGLEVQALARCVGAQKVAASP